MHKYHVDANKDHRRSTYLVVQRIADVPDLANKNKPHRVCDTPAEANGLGTGHTDVDQRPENQPWAKFVEDFEVEGTNSGVELSTNEKLLSSISNMYQWMQCWKFIRRKLRYQNFQRAQAVRPLGRTTSNTKLLVQWT